MNRCSKELVIPKESYLQNSVIKNIINNSTRRYLFIAYCVSGAILSVLHTLPLFTCIHLWSCYTTISNLYLVSLFTDGKNEAVILSILYLSHFTK